MTEPNIHCIPLGSLETNAYIVSADGDCAVVDVGTRPQPLLDYLYKHDLRPGRVLLTHGHGDHVAGIPALRDAFDGLRVLCPVGDVHMMTDPWANLSARFGWALDAGGEADETTKPGTTLHIAGVEWAVLDTSGHSPGGVSYYCESAGVVLCGDALFAGSIGRTDVPGADTDTLLRNIREQLLPLPDDTRVLPGHGPETTIGAERAGNPFLRDTGGVR
ncbi:MAG: MBL fold metallo-hydrolase [Phycisphaerae bacterium]